MRGWIYLYKMTLQMRFPADQANVSILSWPGPGLCKQAAQLAPVLGLPAVRVCLCVCVWVCEVCCSPVNVQHLRTWVDRNVTSCPGTGFRCEWASNCQVPCAAVIDVIRPCLRAKNPTPLPLVGVTPSRAINNLIPKNSVTYLDRPLTGQADSRESRNHRRRHEQVEL